MSQRRKKSAEDVKREIQRVERELSTLIEVQWKYIKQMLRFGMASWIFGICTFFLAVVIFNPGLIVEAPLTAAPLLILALAVPVFVTGATARKFSYRIKRLERIRHGLLMEYERAVLKRIDKMVSSS